MWGGSAVRLNNGIDIALRTLIKTLWRRRSLRENKGRMRKATQTNAGLSSLWREGITIVRSEAFVINIILSRTNYGIWEHLWHFTQKLLRSAYSILMHGVDYAWKASAHWVLNVQTYNYALGEHQDTCILAIEAKAINSRSESSKTQTYIYLTHTAYHIAYVIPTLHRKVVKRCGCMLGSRWSVIVS